MILIAAAIAWQFYAAVAAWFRGRTLRRLLEGLGAEPPLIARLFLVTYPFWILIPILFTAGLLLWLRGGRRSSPVLLIIAAVAVALGLHAWMNEAWFLPLFQLIRQVG